MGDSKNSQRPFSTLARDIGLNIYTLRMKKGMRQRELGKLIGRQAATICFYEHGKRIPTLFILLRIADVFDTTLEELIKGGEVCESLKTGSHPI